MLAAFKRSFAPLIPLMGKGFLHLCFQVVTMLVPILCMPFVTHALLPEEYGRFSLYLVIAGFLVPLMSVGVDQVLSNNYYKLTKAENSDFIGNFLGSVFIMGGVLSVCMLIFSIPLTHWIQLPPYAFLTFGLFGLLSVVVTVGQTVALMEKDNKIQGIYIVGRSVFVYIVALPLLMLSSSWNVMLFSNFMMLIVLAVLSWYYLRRLGLLRLHFKLSAFKPVWALGGMLVFFALSNQIILMTDRLVIQYFLGTHSVGLYVIPLQLMAGCMMLVLALTRITAPWVIKAMTNEDDMQLRRMARLMYLFWILVIAGFTIAALVGGFAVDVLTSDAYNEAIMLVPPLALASMFNTLFILNSSLLVFKRRMRFLSLLTLCVGLLNFGISIIMTQAFGLLGAAYACALAFFIMTAVVTFEMFRSLTNVPWVAAWNDLSELPVRLWFTVRKRRSR